MELDDAIRMLIFSIGVALYGVIGWPALLIAFFLTCWSVAIVINNYRRSKKDGSRST